MAKTKTRCTNCGKFMLPTDEDHCEYEPLSEFGPEKIEHTHRACYDRERASGDER